MKNVKISLLAAGATLVLLACSSMEVDNPTVENFPEGWSTAEYIKVNPDLRALQIKDQVFIMNTISGAENDDDKFLADEEAVKALAIKHAGFTEASFDLTDKDKLKYIKGFNIYGVENESAIFDTLTLDSVVFDRQYVSYGAVEGRPMRACTDKETALVKKGECQADENANVGYVAHLYCSNAGVTYFIDCKADDKCPEVIPESSSSAAPESSSEGGEAPESSSEAAPESSSEGGEPQPESSEAAPESSSSVE